MVSQPLYTYGKGAEKEGFLDLFFFFLVARRYVFGVYILNNFKPLGISGLEKCGLTTPNFRPWNWNEEDGGENKLNENDLGEKEEVYIQE